MVEIARHRHTDPAALRRLLHGELDWIVMKCLEKDRTRRYETASALVDDIQRHIRHEPVRAGPPGAAYKVKKFLRRNRGMALSCALVLATLVMGLAGTSFGLLRARHERDQKEIARKAEQTQRLESERVTDVLEELVSRGIWRQWRVPSLLTPQQLDQFATNHLDGLSDQPRAEARLRAAIGLAYIRIDLDKARRHLARALEIRRREFGDHPLTARSLIDWARLCNAAGDFGGADQALTEALRIQEHLSGPARDDLAQTLLTQAFTEHLRGNSERKILLTNRALAIQRGVFGQDHAAIAMTLVTLAEYVADSGQLELAESHAREALAMQRRLLGDVHFEIAISLDRLGGILWQRGSFAESEAALRESLAMLEKLSGPEDPEAIGTLRKLARTLRDAGRPAEAVAPERESLAICRKVFGDEHVDVAWGLLRLADVLTDAGDAAAAEPLYRESLELYQRVSRGDHPAFAVLGNVGRCLASLGRWEEALPKHEAALEMTQRLFPGDHSEVAVTLYRVGVCLDHLGRSAEALPKLEAALAMSRRLRADILIDKSLSLLGLFLLEQERYAEAEPVLRECLAIREKTLKPDDWRLANSRSMLAGALVGLAAALPPTDPAAVAKFEEAEPLLLDGYAGLCAGLKDNGSVPANIRDQRIREALERIVKLYEAWDQVAPDSAYAEKAAEWRAKLDADVRAPTSGPAP